MGILDKINDFMGRAKTSEPIRRQPPESPLVTANREINRRMKVASDRHFTNQENEKRSHTMSMDGVNVMNAVDALDDLATIFGYVFTEPTFNGSDIHPAPNKRDVCLDIAGGDEKPNWASVRKFIDRKIAGSNIVVGSQSIHSDTYAVFTFIARR